MNIDQLERVAGKVNLQVHRGSSLSSYQLLARELFKEDILLDHLGDCWPLDDVGSWFWAPIKGVRFAQYASGRVAVIGG